MYLTTRGLVLRVTPYNDTDALLTVLSADLGRITVKARGLKRKNSPLVAPCQLLAYSEFTLFMYRNMYTINEARSLELFQQIQKDLEALALGSYFCQAAELISQEDYPDPDLLPLLLNCLYTLSKMQLPRFQIKSVFELRCACIAGYTPNLIGCSNCGAEFPDRFDISQGHLECSRCRITESGGIRMPISAGVLAAMRYICSCNSKKLFSFQAGEQTLEILSQITESYLCTQLERGFSALDFYKSLLVK